MTPDHKDAEAESLLRTTRQAIADSMKMVAAVTDSSASYRRELEAFRKAIEDARATLGKFISD